MEMTSLMLQRERPMTLYSLARWDSLRPQAEFFCSEAQFNANCKEGNYEMPPFGKHHSNQLEILRLSFSF